MNFKRLMTLGVLFTFAFLPSAWADVNQMAQLTNLVEQLQKQMGEMQKILDLQNEKISQLERRRPPMDISGPGGETTPRTGDTEFAEQLKANIGDASAWLKDLKFSADYRLRYEAFDFTSGNPAETDPINRFRFRLRYGLEKKFHPDMKVGFSFASGGGLNGLNDQTSANETLDGNFVYKPISIERAYAMYNPSWAKRGAVENLELAGGKFANPFERGSSLLIWDRDVRPEGAYEKIEFKLAETRDFVLRSYLTAGQFILDEDATLGSGTIGGDAELWAVQFGILPQFQTPFFEKPVNFHSAVSFYAYSDFAEKGNFGAFARGNTNVTGSASELDTGGFQIVESYNELALQPDGLPLLRFFTDLAVNAADDASSPSIVDQNFAWSLGSKVGRAEKKGSWEAGYEYRWVGANAIVGAFGDSDFMTGFANKRGSVVSGKYMLTDSLALEGAAILGNNLSTGTAGNRDEEVRRFQLDLQWKF